jgi:sugar phosphate isomerase/epimerase
MKSLIRKAIPPMALLAALLSGAAGVRAQPELMVYDFNLELGPAGNVDHVKALGFSGLVTQVSVPGDVSKLAAYASHVATLEDFELFAFVVYDFSAAAVGDALWRDALPILAGAGAPLWVIVKHAPSAAALRSLLAEMATTSQAAGVLTVIYPHWNTSIETAAEASVLITEVGHPNLRNSIHTCHEIRGGNQDTLETVVAAHAGETALVTIAGADEDAYSGPFDPLVTWDDAIKPLDQGDFSLLPFLKALDDEGYDGPVILHTFGITGDPDHLQDSLAKYAEYLALVSAPWTDVGSGLAGVSGVPQLVGEGTLIGGDPASLALSNARPDSSAALVMGLALLQAPFKGGTLVPTPHLVIAGILTDGSGALDIGFTWPAGVPAGTMFWVQEWIVDPAGPQGFSSSNGLLGTTP